MMASDSQVGNSADSAELLFRGLSLSSKSAVELLPSTHTEPDTDSKLGKADVNVYYLQVTQYGRYIYTFF